jgi:DsbC/DsbD-like thiol-disulfide interchange protein
MRRAAWKSQLAGVIVLLCALAAALEAAPVAVPHGTVELLAEHSSIKPGSSFQVGLHFQLEKGWHIYWINPGDAGQPPKITWDLPAGLGAGEIQWPYPRPLPAFSMMDFGYEDDVLLLVPMKADATTKPGTAILNANLRMIVCRDVCIPGKASLALAVPVSTAAPAEFAAAKPLFDSARKKLPRQPPAAWKFKVTQNEENFRIDCLIGRTEKHAFFFPLEDNQIENAGPQSVIPLKSGFGLVINKSRKLLKQVDRLRGVLVIGDEAYRFDVPVT